MQSHNQNHGGMGKMALVMIIGCLLPLVILGVIYFFNLTLSVVLVGALILICPLSHLFMMRYMAQSMEHNHENSLRRPKA
jgi:ABC-type transport system involved in cytochrome bd biosynthesis fused ATPase/permease subunit